MLLFAISKKNRDITEWLAIIILSILVSFNLITLLALIEINQNHFFLIKREQGYFIIIIILLFNHFIFVRKKKYKKIVEACAQSDKPLKAFFVLIYVVLSIWAIFYFGGLASESYMYHNSNGLR